MEFGILSSFLSFLPFLLAAGEPAAMTEELPLVSSVVTGGKGTSLMSLVSPHNLHYHIVRLIIHSKWKAEQFGLLNSIIRLVMNNKANNGNYSPSYG